MEVEWDPHGRCYPNVGTKKLSFWRARGGWREWGGIAGTGEAEQGENAHPLTLKGDLAYLGAQDQGPDLVPRPSEGLGQQGLRRR